MSMDKITEICEPHGRIRCSECAYVEELKSELERVTQERDKAVRVLSYIERKIGSDKAREILKELGVEI